MTLLANPATSTAPIDSDAAQPGSGNAFRSARGQSAGSDAEALKYIA